MGGSRVGEGEAFDRLVRAFDTLDGAEAFVHPDAMAAVAASGKRAERAALDEVVDVVGTAVGRARRRCADCSAGSSRRGRPSRRRARVRGIALDVALIHVASMSNLAAALGWALVDLLEHPIVRCARVAGAATTTSPSGARWSRTRMAQRSIMTPRRAVTGRAGHRRRTYEVPPGWTIATLLPLLNTSAAPDLARWDPDRWTGHRLRDTRSRWRRRCW